MTNNLTVPLDARLLIDKLWPRGIAKDDLPIDAGLKALTPSPALRKWFGHDPAKWNDVSDRNLDELCAVPAAVDIALEWCRKGLATLVYAAKDAQHTRALALCDNTAARLATD